MSTLRELHEAATGAPWEAGRVPGFEHVVYANDDGSVTGVCRCDNNPRKAFRNGGKDPADAALIVALRNAYASGMLVEREPYDALVEAAEEAWASWRDYTGGGGQFPADMDALKVALDRKD